MAQLGSNTSGHLFDTSFTTNGTLYSDGNGVITSTATGTANQVLTSNGTGSAPTYQTGAGLLLAAGNVTNSEIKALHGSPKQIIAAPGNGAFIQVLHAMYTLNYGGNNAFVSGGTTIQLFYSTVQTIIQLLNSATINSTASQVAVLATPVTITTAYATLTNLAVNIYNQGSEITGNAANDNTMSYSVIYRIVTIP